MTAPRPNTPAQIQRAASRVIRRLARGSAARHGAARGADERVHRLSYDKGDPRALIFEPLADGTEAGTLAVIDAIVDGARRFNNIERLKRRATEKEAGLRPSGWRGPVNAHAQAVLSAVLRHHWHDFKTGKLDPAYSQLQKATGFARSTIANALEALKEHGFLDWVRRTVMTATGRKQTNNGYVIRVARLPALVRGLVMRCRELARLRRARPAPTTAPKLAPATPSTRPPGHSLSPS